MADTLRCLTSSPSRAAAAVLALACILLSSARAASADGARVLEGERKIEGVAFAADPATGRAWVDVTVARRFATGKEVRAHGARVPVAVSELVYDPSVDGIVHVEGATRTTCATLRSELVVPTGACRIAATTERRAVDTGFGSVLRDVVVVRVVPER